MQDAKSQKDDEFRLEPEFESEDDSDAQSDSESEVSDSPEPAPQKSSKRRLIELPDAPDIDVRDATPSQRFKDSQEFVSTIKRKLADTDEVDKSLQRQRVQDKHRRVREWRREQRRAQNGQQSESVVMLGGADDDDDDQDNDLYEQSDATHPESSESEAPAIKRQRVDTLEAQALAALSKI